MDERTMLRYVDELQGQIDRLKKMIGGGGGGTKDYDKLNNRPKINNITLSGNKKSSDLKIAYNMTESEYESATKNPESIYFLQDNAGTVIETEDAFTIEWEAYSDPAYVATLSYTPSDQDVTGITSVTCDTDTIEIVTFSLDHGDVSVTIGCTDPSEVPDEVEFTFTFTQPVGGSRIVKNNIEFGSDLRSNTPIRIGTWIDGKPLYRVIITETLTGQSQTVPLISSSYKIVNFNAVVNTPSGTSAVWGYFNGAQDNFTGYIDSDNQARVVAGGVAGVCNFMVDYVEK